ncbi:MAG TPA: hypothetical protein VFC56_19870 [Stellaceae bacterium]|nr:hypothetical protein [Stellaceae bacterium]
MPNFPCEFELPDEWWAEAGMAAFTPQGPAYLSAGGAQLVPLGEIEPPYGKHLKPRDWCGFDRARMNHILTSFATGVALKPVPLLALPFSDLPSSTTYSYRALDGYHRFYASIAAGFEFLPALVLR